VCQQPDQLQLTVNIPILPMDKGLSRFASEPRTSSGHQAQIRQAAQQDQEKQP